MQGDQFGSYDHNPGEKDGGLDQSASRIGEESGWILDVLKAETVRFTDSLDMKCQRKMGCES